MWQNWKNKDSFFIDPENSYAKCQYLFYNIFAILINDI